MKNLNKYMMTACSVILLACGSDNNSTSAYQEEVQAFVDETIKENFVSNQLQVDCKVVYGESEEDVCGLQTMELDGGVLNVYGMGYTRSVWCADKAVSSVSLVNYEVSVTIQSIDVTDFTAKKKLITDIVSMVTPFKADCEKEKGSYSSKDGLEHVCEIPLEQNAEKPDFILYDDPFWSEIVTDIANACGARL